MWHFFKHIWIQDILFKIPNHFWRNPFLNFDSYMNLNPSYVKKKYKKNVSERVKRSIWSWWNNCTLEMIVWKGKRMWVKCYCVHTFLSAEGISLTGSHVLGFFHVPDFIFIQCIYILNLKIHYCMASCRFDYLFVWIFFFGQYCSEFKLHVLWFVEICLFYKLKLWEKKFLPVNFD